MLETKGTGRCWKYQKETIENQKSLCQQYETLIVTEPVFSKEAVEQYLEKKPSYKKSNTSIFATGTEENPDVCIYCNEKHKVGGFNSFMEKISRRKGSSFSQSKNLVIDAENQWLKVTMQRHVYTQELTCCSCKGNHPGC